MFVATVGQGNVRRCFIRVMKACYLGRDHSRFDELCRIFYSKYVLSRHLITVHLDGNDEGQRFECPACSISLVNMNHLRLHVEDVYGIKTEVSRRIKSR